MEHSAEVPPPAGGRGRVGATGWITLLAVLLGIGCGAGPHRVEDQSEGIVVSGGFKAYYPKSLPSSCYTAVVPVSTQPVMVYDTERQGGEGQGPRPYLTFRLHPYIAAAQSYTVGGNRSSVLNHIHLVRGHDDGWEGVSGSVTIVAVANGVISGTLDIPSLTPYGGVVKWGAVSMTGAWTCKLD